MWKRRHDRKLNAADAGLNRSTKVARRRLKRASKLLNQNDSAAFYEEVLRALYEYVQDKCQLSQEHLTKDNVADKMAARGIAPELVDKMLHVIDSCEFARFAPGDPSQRMNAVYEEAMQTIGAIERR
jgi:hypothetical protein